MKKIILVFGVLFFLVPSHAINQNELQQARIVIGEMVDELAIMQECVCIAHAGKIERVILTVGQKQSLRDKYEEAKQELQNLYQQLP